MSSVTTLPALARLHLHSVALINPPTGARAKSGRGGGRAGAVRSRKPNPTAERFLHSRWRPQALGGGLTQPYSSPNETLRLIRRTRQARNTHSLSSAGPEAGSAPQLEGELAHPPARITADEGTEPRAAPPRVLGSSPSQHPSQHPTQHPSSQRSSSSSKSAPVQHVNLALHVPMSAPMSVPESTPGSRSCQAVKSTPVSTSTRASPARAAEGFGRASHAQRHSAAARNPRPASAASS